MTEISSISSLSGYQDSISKEDSSEKPSWEKLGTASLSATLLVSASALFPGSSRKKHSVRHSVALSPVVPIYVTQMESIAAECLPKKISPAPPSIDDPLRVLGQLLKKTKLRCTPVDQKIIREIITTVERGGIDLLWKRTRLDELGEKIMPVHPYKFLSTILLDPELKTSLRNIFNDIFPFKKQGFLGGVKKGMEREAANLEEHMDEFASEMGTSSEIIRPLIRAGDWNGLVLHLLETTQGQKTRLSPE